MNKKYYSMTSYKMSTNCVWLLITGGRDSKDFIANPDILNVIELGMIVTYVMRDRCNREILTITIVSFFAHQK